MSTTFYLKISKKFDQICTQLFSSKLTYAIAGVLNNFPNLLVNTLPHKTKYLKPQEF